MPHSGFWRAVIRLRIAFFVIEAVLATIAFALRSSGDLIELAFQEPGVVLLGKLLRPSSNREAALLLVVFACLSGLLSLFALRRNRLAMALFVGIVVPISILGTFIKFTFASVFLAMLTLTAVIIGWRLPGPPSAPQRSPEPAVD